eukprot:7258182-Prymnesium_polylepis.1
MVVCTSPLEACSSESLAALCFASRVRSVRNLVVRQVPVLMAAMDGPRVAGPLGTVLPPPAFAGSAADAAKEERVDVEVATMQWMLRDVELELVAREHELTQVRAAAASKLESATVREEALQDELRV